MAKQRCTGMVLGQLLRGCTSRAVLNRQDRRLAQITHAPRSCDCWTDRRTGTVGLRDRAGHSSLALQVWPPPAPSDLQSRWDRSVLEIIHLEVPLFWRLWRQ